MLVAGIDVGAATAKTVILNERGVIVGSSIAPTGPNVVEIAKKVFRVSLDKAGVSADRVGRIVATGYGRNSVDFADQAVTEITCHAKGAAHVIPETKMIIDIGGQDSKAIRVSEEGTVSDFVMNDKCAAGTGRFFEVMAGVLELSLEELGFVSLTAESVCKISSICTVFAESEVISLRAERQRVEDIIAGIHSSCAKRICAMASQIGITSPVVFTGGVAKNKGMQKALEEEFNTQLIIPEEPQLMGALGAALIAR